MESSIDPKEYISEDIFALEQRKIFRSLWVFVGLKQQVSQRNQFFKRIVGGVNVLVQNMDGQVKAFENACAHRQMEMQWEEHGCRPLVCKYHGWSYDGCGKVRGIPSQANQYFFSKEEQESLRLREFSLAEVGNFIFVNLARAPLPIEKQFPPGVLDKLKDVSSHMDSEVIVTKTTVKANWKLCFSNNYDSAHVPFLHAKTFGRAFSQAPCDQDIKEIIANYEGLDNEDTWDQAVNMSYKVSYAFRDFQRYDWHLLVDRWGKEKVHHLWCMFPSLEVYSPAGYSFGIHSYQPISPHVTEVITTLAMARKVRNSAAMPPDLWHHSKSMVLWEHMKGDRTVTSEDLVAAEKVHKVLHSDSSRAMLGKCDLRIEKLCRITRAMVQGEIEV
jgi:phenylpropionate dioxygenase-like ring-hydroxylating dioxygenase large terminal subunit